MSNIKDEELLPNTEDNRFKLNYEPTEIEGECLLESIVPVKKSMPLFILFIVFSICFAGLPLLITYWFPWLKRTIYYRPCTLEEATDFHIINYDGISTYPDKEVKPFYFTYGNVKDTILFKNRYLTYLVIDGTVKAASFDLMSRINEIMNHPQPDKKSYVSESDVVNLMGSYGPGVMKIEMPSVPVLFLQEVMRPLYLFIVFSIVLWYYEEYTYYASVIAGTAAIGIITNLIQTYQNNKRIHEMAFHEEKINTLRSGEIIEISSTQLVPGDIVFLKNQIKIPFDGVLLECEALINECALTGESVPILKKPESVSKASDLKASYIYEGTSLIQIGNKKKTIKFDHYREKYGVPIMVARTNFATMKGQLIRVISFPKERENIFERQSAKFLLFLFILSVVSYCILLSKLVGIVDGHTLFIKFLDLITITVPPGLPVSMTFGIIFALEKMKSKKIYCSSPNKVIHGGMTDMLCFDKTGTLTEDFMDFNCLVLFDGKQFCDPVVNGEVALNAQNDEETQKVKSEKLIKIIEKNDKIISALNNMAMNHTIVSLEETGEHVGDPMEIKLFEFGEFNFSNEQSDNSEIIMAFDSKRGHKGFVYKRFDFDSQLFRMSAIGKSNHSGDNFHLYIKGSPELMIEIFKPETIPSNYNEILKSYTSQGFRVLAIGSRKVEEKALSSPRLELEKEINFEGFEVFENRLKPETKDAIAELVEAELPCVMITGDNALTGANMAYQCGISDPEKKTLICNFNSQTNEFSIEDFIYKKAGEELPQLKSRKNAALKEETHPKIKPSADSKISSSDIELGALTNIDKDKQRLIQSLNDQSVQLCITGPALNHIFDLDVEKLSNIDEYILLRTTVFARAKPNDKIKAISLYQKIGKKVSMCGDGANDCGALKQADIGLSLSMAEASISAPFTSQITNISSMIELLKECRAGLATNFSLFNIMALYSLIQYTTTIMTQFFFSYPGDFQYLYWDVFCNFLFFLTIGYTGTAKKLSVEIPNASLFTVSNLMQVLIMFGLQLMGQFLILFGLSHGTFSEGLGYYGTITYDAFLVEEDFVTESYENNALFLFTNIMYIFTLLAFSISKPWRKHFLTNPLFDIVLVFVLVYSLVIIVVPASRLNLFEVVFMNYQPFNWFIFGLALGIGIVIYVNQKFIMEPFFAWLKMKYVDKQWI